MSPHTDPNNPPGGWGLMLPPGTAPPCERRLEPLAAASFAFGLWGLLTIWCCGVFAVVFGLAGIVSGIISLQRIAAGRDRLRGRSVAVTGIVLGIIGPALLVVLVFVFALAPGIVRASGR